jgi:ribosomal protein S18 acetylase RimI-like enzyme
MESKDAVIALDNKLVGFVTSKAGKTAICSAFGLIVHPDYRNLGLAKKNQIKSI